MQIEKQDLENIIKETVQATILELGIGKVTPKQERSAYQKTELLLWNYRNFQKVIKEKLEEIEDLRKYGVPHKGEAVHTYAGSVGTVNEICTEDETISNAICNVQESIREVQLVLNKIDVAMLTLKNDPYYKILEMFYFEGHLQEDIAMYYTCVQSTITKNKNRLVRELSMRLFPNDVIKEMVQ